MSTDGKVNVDGWKVAHDTDAMGNAKEQTIAKAASGVAVSNNMSWVKTAKTTSISIDNVATLGSANQLGKHPSTVTYGWTVTKMSAAECNAEDLLWFS